MACLFDITVWHYTAAYVVLLAAGGFCMRNVYDFDKTIYDGDSTLNFYLFCVRQQPSILRWLPKQCYAILQYKTGKISKTKMKEEFYSFFQGIPDIQQFVEKFWIKEKAKIKNWYLEQQSDSDLIISASPEFLLRPICEELGIKYLIASKVDMYTGKYEGENCYGEEKVKRFYRDYANDTIGKFYSDSYSDTPLAELAEQAYIVKHNKLLSWER